jgi:hypothetical protein
MRTESFPISSQMTYEDDRLSIKRNNSCEKKLLVMIDHIYIDDGIKIDQTFLYEMLLICCFRLIFFFFFRFKKFWRKDAGEFIKAQDPDLPWSYTLSKEGRFSNIREFPSLDEPPQKKKTTRASRRALPGIGADSVRSTLPVRGSRTIRQTFHSEQEHLAVSI